MNLPPVLAASIFSTSAPLSFRSDLKTARSLISTA